MGAEPFEVSLQNVGPDFLRTGRLGGAAEVATSFASPGDDVWYFKVRGSAVGGAGRPPTVSRQAFVIKECDKLGYVTPEMKCLQPTGEPEPKSRHLPLRRWNIDLARLQTIVQSHKDCPSVINAIVVTTARRLRGAAAEVGPPRDDESPVVRLTSHLPDDYAVISVVGRGRGRGVEYFVVGAERGEVIAAGAYEPQEEELFRPPGAPAARPGAPPTRPAGKP